MIKTVLVGKDTTGGVAAQVTSRGQLVTSPLSYSNAYTASATVDDTAANLVGPKANNKFVITDIILTGTKTINTVTDATVIIYEASASDTITVDSEILNISVPQSEVIPLTGLNLITSGTSKYINFKTSDETVDCTLMGYYVGHHHEIESE